MWWKLGFDWDIEQFPTWFLSTLEDKLYLVSSGAADPYEICMFTWKKQQVKDNWKEILLTAFPWPYHLGRWEFG